MKYIATTDLPHLGIFKGQVVETSKPAPGMAPLARITKDRSRPVQQKISPKGWKLFADVLTFVIQKFVINKKA